MLTRLVVDCCVSFVIGDITPLIFASESCRLRLASTGSNPDGQGICCVSLLLFASGVGGRSSAEASLGKSIALSNSSSFVAAAAAAAAVVDELLSDSA